MGPKQGLNILSFMFLPPLFFHLFFFEEYNEEENDAR